ncbi:MAG TPA: peptide deformylase [Bryobacteraceae bacterium]|nr:peptide deformylase [Bryobacteraceae bacterium]
MVRNVVKYGHPVLRQKGARVERITAAIKALVEDLIETMYAAKGLGLAAQQIGEPVQVTVVDVRALDRPSTLEWAGKPVNAADFMPMVLINPEIKPFGERVSGPEGCLSFPEIFADISRPDFAEVTALNRKGERVAFRCSGLLSRVIQHEVDHLNGILFIDRMDAPTKSGLKPQLAELQASTKEELKKPGGADKPKD